jgi:hypothetical protein
MSPRRIQTLTWMAAFLAGGALVWTVGDFLRHRADYESPVPQEELERVVKGVEEPEPPKDDRVAVKSINRVFHSMNWTGKEEPKVAPPPGGEPPPPPKVAMSSLLFVLVLQIDTSDSEASIAYVGYTPESKLQKPDADPEERLLRVGERLASPHQYARIEAIGMDGVRFVFDDTAREAETVAPAKPPEDRVTIVMVDQAILPDPSDGSIPTVANPAPYAPKRTTAIARNEYQLGTDTLSEVDRDYSQILARDVAYKTARDPRTGQIKGLLVTSVTPNSIPAEHGLTEGEIVKSINGSPVTSVAEAVSFVKQNAQSTNTWVVEFEKQGRTYTRTYHSPPR